MQMVNQVEIFQGSDGQALVEVRFYQDTVWLNQKLMAVLFENDSDTISLHLKNIYKELELSEDSTTEDSSVVQKEGEVTIRLRSIIF